MITLDQDYTLQADSDCWTLIYSHVGDISDDTGKPVVSVNRTYHGTLEQAIKYYCDETLKTSESIADILESIKKLHQKIDTIFANIPKSTVA